MTAMCFDYVNESSIPKELLCSVCLKPWLNPTETQCEHIFCSSCIFPIANTHHICPMCRAPIDTRGLKKATRVLREQVDRLEVYCANKSKGCVWSGSRDAMTSHSAVCALGDRVVTAPDPTAVVLTAASEYDTLTHTQPHKILTMAHIQAPTINKTSLKRKPISVCAVLDRSGSMGGNKLDLLKESMRFVIAELTEGDQLGVIAYDDGVLEALPLTEMTPEGKVMAVQAVDSLTAGNKTNISAGLFAGVDALRGRFAPHEYGLTQQGSTTQNPFLPAPTPSLVAMDPVTGMRQFNVTIGNDCTPMRRDGNALVRYTVYAKVSSNATAAVHSVNLRKLDGTVKSTKGENGVFSFTEIEPTMPQQVELTILFHADLHLQPRTVVHSLVEDEERSKQNVVIGLSETAIGQQTKHATRTASKNGVNSVWLFTDGQANDGITQESELEKALKAHIARGMEVSVYTFGFGSDHNVKLLKGTAAAFSGMYYFIESTKTMKANFADCLGGLVSVVCQNIRLELQVTEQVQLLRVITDYPHTVQGQRAVITMKDLYSEEQRDIMIEVMIPALPTPVSSQAVARWRLECMSALTGCMQCVCCDAVIARPESVAPQDAKVNIAVDEQRNRMQVADALKQANEMARQGQRAQALRALEGCKQYVGMTPSYATPYCVALGRDMDKAMDDLKAYDAKGQFELARREHGHRQQRCCDWRESAMYSNACQANLRRKAGPEGDKK